MSLRSPALLVVLSLALLMAGSSVWADLPPPAYVRGAKEGQGFLMTKFGRCFVVTAQHVVEGVATGDVAGVGSDETQVQGEYALVGEDKASDVAVLLVTGPLTSDCGSDYTKGASDESLRRKSRAVIPYVYPNGRILREAYGGLIDDVASQDLELAFEGGDQNLAQGMSGGIVGIADLPAGMLLSVTGNHGNVLRYDALMDVVFKLLRSAPLTADRPGKVLGTASGESLSAGLANWSVAPLQPQFATSNLLRPPGPEVWKASLRQGPVTIDIQLRGRQAHSVSYVELRQGEAPADQLVRTYEISVSPDGTSWFYVNRGEFVQGAASSSVSFAPRGARFVRLRVLDSFDNTEHIAALGRIVIR